MNVAAVSGLVTAGTGFEVDPTVTTDSDSFLLLLVAQLRGQDPLEPMDNQDFVTQLVQFSSLQNMVELKSVVWALVEAQRHSYAVSLLGCEVEYMDEAGNLQQGEVAQVNLSVGGEPLLVIDGNEIYLDQVIAVSHSAADA